MNIPQSCNNPVNIMLKKAPIGEAVQLYGCNDKTGLGYAVFASPFAGWRAAHRQIEADQARELTLGQFIAKFAPPNENDTSAYLEFVMHELHVDKDHPLKALSKYALAGIMAQMEGYYNKER
jgi:hypothetical protein